MDADKKKPLSGASLFLERAAAFFGQVSATGLIVLWYARTHTVTRSGFRFVGEWLPAIFAGYAGGLAGCYFVFAELCVTGSRCFRRPLFWLGVALLIPAALEWSWILRGILLG